jgi:DNA-binding Lrp family transcriptional regulator|tara:strand:- start:1088 stop:1375 length:288 start_codon:yes stop_codon:yes gene_type:complete
MNHLTSEQIIQEIELAWGSNKYTDSENCYTLKELKKLLELSDNAVYARLDVLEEAGMLRCTTKLVETRATTMSGKRVVRPVPAYQVVPKERKDGE